MFDSHDTVPTHLTEDLGKARAAALAIYCSGDSPNIQISGSNLVLLDGASVYTISLSGRSSTEVSAEISKTASSYSSRVLMEVDDVSDASPSVSLSDVSADGAVIVRLEGHTIRSINETAFRLLPPYTAGRREPWYPRVQTGTLKKRSNGVDWIFTIPEYDLQAWSRLFGQPYMEMNRVTLQRNGAKSFQAPRFPILWRKKNFFLFVNGQKQHPSSIVDIDEFNGIVYVEKAYDDADEIEATYTYREDGYIYGGLDLNPSEFHNPAILGRYSVVYLKPRSGDGGIVHGNTVYHQESDSLLGAIVSIPRTDEPILILGACHVSPTSTSKTIRVSDTRTWGGGIKEDLRDKAASRNGEVWSTTDYGFYDGLPYGGAAMVLGVSSSIKDALTEAEIMGAIKKHTAFGSAVLVEYR